MRVGKNDLVVDWHDSDHEVFAVGLVHNETESGLESFFELTSRDAGREGIRNACARCSCGWRSERIVLAEPLRWMNGGFLEYSERSHIRLVRLWDEHVALVAYHVRLAQHPQARKRITALLIADLESNERCHCGHTRSWHVNNAPYCSHYEGFDPVRDHMCYSGFPDRASGCHCREFRFMPSPA